MDHRVAEEKDLFLYKLTRSLLSPSRTIEGETGADKPYQNIVAALAMLDKLENVIRRSISESDTPGK